MKMLENYDKKVFDIIQKELKRQEEEIELIASENYVSKAVLEAIWSIFTNKYAEGYPWKRYYEGCEYVDEIENLAIQRVKKLFGAEYVNVQPLSWSPANLAVYLAFLNPGDKILSLSLDQWGHLSHGHFLNFSGKFYNIIPYHLDKETEEIDMDEVEKLALKEKPKLILSWFSAYSKNLDWKRFREISDKVGAILMWDISHIAWLIAWWVLENPVPYLDIITTTTHKTLRWPRWAIIMAKEKFAKKLDTAVFPWIQGWPHVNLITAKAVAFKEALEPSFKEYAQQVVKNAKVFAKILIDNNFKVVSNWTQNHIVLVDVYKSLGISWKQAEQILKKVWISVNKNMVPYDTRKPLDPSWVRIWTSAITTRWMKEKEVETIAEIFIQALKNKDNETKLKELREKGLKLCNMFPIYK